MTKEELVDIVENAMMDRMDMDVGIDKLAEAVVETLIIELEIDLEDVQ